MSNENNASGINVRTIGGDDAAKQTTTPPGGGGGDGTASAGCKSHD